MRRWPLAALFALIGWPATPARADDIRVRPVPVAATVVADAAGATALTAYGGHVVWSRLDPATNRWQLVHRAGGDVTALPVPERSVAARPRRRRGARHARRSRGRRRAGDRADQGAGAGRRPLRPDRLRGLPVLARRPAGGSVVATRLALDAPARVAGLVLMGARPTFRDLDDLYAEIEAFGDAVDPGWVREFQLSTLARPVPAEWLDMVVEESLKVPARVWKALVEPTLRADHAGELGRISAPVLLAWGDQDGIARRADQDEPLRLIPGARLVVYEGGGHAFHWDNPAAFARDLSAFVGEVVAR